MSRLVRNYKITLENRFDNENDMHTIHGKTGESFSTLASFSYYSYQSTLYCIFESATR